MPDNPTPDMLKKMKMDIISPEESGSGAIQPANNGGLKSGKVRVVTMEEVEDEDMDRNFAPGGDADYFVEEDDEGRFFGGGLTSEQKDILNIFENASGEGVQGEVRDKSPHQCFHSLNHF
jgi:beta-catenin-like protein 1